MAHEEEELAKRQDRAIQPHAPTGALIIPAYLQRRQEVIAVNRHDLEDLMTFDGLELGFGAIGAFLLSGGAWLGVEKWLDQTEFHWTPLLVACALSAAFGAIFVGAATIMRWKKRGRIKRIFEETSPPKPA